MSETRQTGRVKYYDAKRGWGFVSDAAGGPDQFLHVSNVLHCPVGGLRVGQLVEYAIGANREGREQAVAVSVIDEHAAAEMEHMG